MSRTDAHTMTFHLPSDAHPHVRQLIQQNQQRFDALLSAADYVPVQSMGIVGAGLMGTAVAAASIAAGIKVVLYDADSSALEKATNATLTELIALGCESEQQAARLLDERLSIAKRLDELAACDLVLESITEKIDVKRGLYAELEPLLAEQTVLATNTSTIPVERLAAELHRPEQFCAVHFFHPVGRRPLVEIVRGLKTTDSAVARAVGYARAINKMALVVNDGPGFVVNRLLMPYLTESAELLLDGIPIERVEQVATEFGMAKGPLTLLDEIGLDTAVAGGRTLWEAFPSRVVISPLMIAMFKTSRFGVKSGAGFFDYTNRVPRASCPCKTMGTGDTPVAPNRVSSDCTPPVDQVALEKIAQWKRTPKSLDDEQIRDRLLLPMIVEATWLLEEHKVAGPQDIDLGTLFGLGFPAKRGGLLCWADILGMSQIVSRIEELGLQTKISPTLRQMSETGQGFYDQADS